MITGNRTQKLIYSAILLAIMLILFWTPFGFIQIGPFAITTMHIPVIVVSILLGLRYGGFFGLIFGLLSMYRATTTLTPTSFVFSPFVPTPGSEHGDFKAIIIAILPRILIGIFPALIIALFKKNDGASKYTLGFGLAGFIGSLTNTIFVLSLMGIFFKNKLGISSVIAFIAGVVTSNGIIEAIVATLVVVAMSNVFIVAEKKLKKAYI
ncbi:MAG: ECF transporter S component [Streptococcaceae bacterium]|jgi:uncharacterized membrane protein|nr:ECF transporter S component [Streptococcaceae bacterium]